MVKRAHAAGLTVTSWTFRAGEKTAFASVGDEMAHFLYTLGIDALFTNNPDQFPRIDAMPNFPSSGPSVPPPVSPARR